MQWVTAARVRPHIRECYLRRCAFLQKQFICGLVKEKDGECAVEDSMRLSGREFVGGFFGCRGDDIVIIVQDKDSVALHELRLRD